MKAKDAFSMLEESGEFFGDELFITPKNALKLVDFAQANDLAILGIEGFYFENDTIQSRLDWIADFSDWRATTWNGYQQGCNAASKNFIDMLEREAKARDVRVSLSIISASEWRAERKKESSRSR